MSDAAAAPQLELRPMNVTIHEYTAFGAPTLRAIGTSVDTFSLFVAWRAGGRADRHAVRVRTVTLPLTHELQKRLEKDWRRRRLLVSGKDAAMALLPPETNVARFARVVETLALSQAQIRKDAGAVRAVRAYLRREVPPDLLRGPGADAGDPSAAAARVQGLLDWFGDSFSYFHRGCTHARCPTPGVGSAQPEHVRVLGCIGPGLVDRVVGRASRVELHLCTSGEGCGRVSMFPRNRAPGPILRTRRGRCGEYSYVWLLMLRSLGYEARWVSDWTDHCWVEVRLPGHPGWVHTDPCERALGRPRMYAEGWGKRHNYVVAFGEGRLEDVTPVYALDRSTYMAERDLSEMDVERVLDEVNHRMQGGRSTGDHDGPKRSPFQAASRVASPRINAAIAVARDRVNALAGR